jgi:hypothetical protein
LLGIIAAVEPEGCRMLTNRRSSRKEGYDKQREHSQRIVDATKSMKSVQHTDSKGRPIRSGADVKEGADGGIDLVTTVTTKNKQSMSWVKKIFEDKVKLR